MLLLQRGTSNNSGAVSCKQRTTTMDVVGARVWALNQFFGTRFLFEVLSDGCLVLHKHCNACQGSLDTTINASRADCTDRKSASRSSDGLRFDGRRFSRDHSKGYNRRSRSKCSTAEGEVTINAFRSAFHDRT